MSRPRRKSDLTCEKVPIHLTPAERAEVERKLAPHQSLSDFGRRAVLDNPGRPPKRTDPEASNAIAQIGLLGSNLNQTVRALNTAYKQDRLFVNEALVRDLEAQIESIRVEMERLQTVIAESGLPEEENDVDATDAAELDPADQAEIEETADDHAA